MGMNRLSNDTKSHVFFKPRLRPVLLSCVTASTHSSVPASALVGQVSVPRTPKWRRS